MRGRNRYRIASYIKTVRERGEERNKVKEERKRVRERGQRKRGPRMSRQDLGNAASNGAER